MHGEQGAHEGGFAHTGAAGDDEHALLHGLMHGGALAGGEGDLLGFLRLSDGGIDLRLTGQQGRWGGREGDQVLGNALLGTAQMGQADDGLARQRMGHHGALLAEVSDAGLHGGFSDLEEVGAVLGQKSMRQAGVAA
jgi:hypothetical protein